MPPCSGSWILENTIGAVGTEGRSNPKSSFSCSCSCCKTWAWDFTSSAFILSSCSLTSERSTSASLASAPSHQVLVSYSTVSSIKVLYHLQLVLPLQLLF
ncbi:hypothetical protein [Candidatus Liberibacter solanacearum]|uniref:hypothetical protein n=1 Tax=Candidatus Liberibacter solanacearum TaxID=556287 RepID=UPI0009B8F4D9|nr:hypothetical protein [Candidatus Liberibacter solanacearum]